MTEACVLTKNNHPVSIFSEIHSSKEKHFTSINDVTFSAMERGAALFGKATFAMDRGYDDNKMFLKLDELEQDSTSSGEHEKCPPVALLMRLPLLQTMTARFLRLSALCPSIGNETSTFLSS